MATPRSRSAASRIDSGADQRAHSPICSSSEGAPPAGASSSDLQVVRGGLRVARAAVLLVLGHEARDVDQDVALVQGHDADALRGAADDADLVHRLRGS